MAWQRFVNSRIMCKFAEEFCQKTDEQVAKKNYIWYTNTIISLSVQE